MHSRALGCWRSPLLPAPAVGSHGATPRSSQKDSAEADSGDWWGWGAGRGNTGDFEGSFLWLQQALKYPWRKE